MKATPLTDFIQNTTTVGTQELAERVARALVERQLAACVHVGGPVSSTYRWRGAVETSLEWTCEIKTRRNLFDEVAHLIREIHSYDVPQIVATPIVAGTDEYLRWLGEETT
jgi:periplasmic divalent cation tolerance protein